MNREMLLELIEATRVNSYSCLMVALGEIIKGVQSHIYPDDLHEYGLEKEPHITALYGIHTNNVEEVKSVLSLKPISFSLASLSLFKKMMSMTF